jgi:hypothetical protein
MMTGFFILSPHEELRKTITVAMSRLAADEPAHGQIMPKPLGVVHILITGETSANGLSQHADKRIIQRLRVLRRLAGLLPRAGGL